MNREQQPTNDTKEADAWVRNGNGRRHGDRGRA
jgi:hypothetical protein